jgi:RNA recognition motif-containing protein
MAAGEAQNAIQQTNGFQMGGRPLRVNEAQERAPRSKPSGGGGYGGGGVVGVVAVAGVAAPDAGNYHRTDAR